jgi:hypothetical protein
MKFKCNYPDCKQEFDIDCPTTEIYQHLLEAHNIDVMNPRDLMKASFIIQAIKGEN